MKNKNVLISGAGIAGLSLAYWLKKYGFVPTIVEKHPTLRHEGYKLDIRGAAMDVIKRMGIESAVYESRTDIQKSLFVDESGKHVTESTPELCGARSEGDLEIVRGDLCRILFEQIEETECLFNDSITKITQNETGVQVEFERNPPRTFDLVIGADGLHSRVRKLGFGDESLFLKKLGPYVSFYSIPNYLKLDRVEIEYHFSKRFVIAYCPRDGMAKAGFAFSTKTDGFDLTDESQQKAFLKKAFADAGWEVPRLLSFVDETPDFYFDCMAQIHMPHWTKGRLALAGDAGYAVSPLAGQGTSVALVGAYILAGELAEAKGDYSTAFLRYEELMRDFVKKNQALADMGASLMNEDNNTWITSIMIWLNYNAGRFIPGRMIQFFKNLGLKRTIKASNSIQIKNYGSTHLNCDAIDHLA